MLFGGFQKMTVLDFPGKIACIVFTQGCNFKCPFCHNRSLVVEENDMISQEEVFSYLNKRKGILDGVCISGGEPLLHKDIFSFMKKVKDMGLSVKLDTNGYLPDRLEYAISNGLVDYVAMDIKNCKEKYAKTSACPNIDISKIEKSVEILMNGNVDYEFRTTVVRELHEESDFVKIGEWIRGAKRYYIQSFVDSGDVIEEGLSSLDTQALNRILTTVSPYVEHASLRGV